MPLHSRTDQQSLTASEEADGLFSELMHARGSDYPAIIAAAEQPTTTRLREILDAVASLSPEQLQRRNFSALTTHAVFVPDINFPVKTPLLVAIDAERVEKFVYFLELARHLMVLITDRIAKKYRTLGAFESSMRKLWNGVL